jgi:hypothetical protein
MEMEHRKREENILEVNVLEAGEASKVFEIVAVLKLLFQESILLHAGLGNGSPEVIEKVAHHVKIDTKRLAKCKLINRLLLEVNGGWRSMFFEREHTVPFGLCNGRPKVVWQVETNR